MEIRRQEDVLGLNGVLKTGQAYYDGDYPGQTDYWNRMPAPRVRIRTILRELGYLTPKNLVDLGCGGGGLLREIRKRFPQLPVTGVDLSQTQISNNEKSDPSCSWMWVDLGKKDGLPRGILGRFNALVSSEVIEHVPDPELFLTNAAQLAAPGATLILSTQSGRVGETEKMVGHLRHFSRQEMRDLLVKTGWNPVKVWNSGWPFHDLSKRLANVSPNRSMQAFGNKPYGTFQKLICWCLQIAFLFNSRKYGAQLFAVAKLR